LRDLPRHVRCGYRRSSGVSPLVARQSKRIDRQQCCRLLDSVDTVRVLSRALSNFGRRYPVSFRAFWSPDAVAVIVPFAASRALIFAVLALAPTVFARGWYWHPGGLLAKLTQWDSVYYLHIARHGLFYSPETVGTVGFFPFYSILVRGMAFVFHDYRVAAIVVANICLLVAGFLLHRLVRIDFPDRKIADAAVTFLMFSPVSFFFSTAYTEATFVMLAIGCFLAALRGWWWTAGLCGMALAATRNVGFFMAIPLAIEYLRQHWDRRRPFAAFLRPRILSIALVPLGLALFMLYSYVKIHDAFAYTHASAEFGRRLVSPLQTLATVHTVPLFHRWLFVGAIVTAMALWCAGVLLKMRATYLVWAALLIATYLCSNSLEAIPRYLTVVFPFFIVVAVLTTRYAWSYIPLLASSVALLTLCTVLLAMGFWMT
jgi:hypothetical protein